MILVDRTLCPPPMGWDNQVKKALPASFARQAESFEKRAINSAERRGGFAAFAPDALPRNKKGEPEFPDKWKKHKKAIATMSYGKCVYCEGVVVAVDYGPVEHFQPKSIFPSLAYAWENYFLGCKLCNTAKGNKWPPRGSYVRPDQGDPSRHFEYSENGRMEARSLRSGAAQMVQDLQLNRDDLTDRRNLAIQKALSLLVGAIALWEEGQPRAREFALLACGSEKDPYSAAVKQCVARAWECATSQSLV